MIATTMIAPMTMAMIAMVLTLSSYPWWAMWGNVWATRIPHRRTPTTPRYGISLWATPCLPIGNLRLARRDARAPAREALP